MTRAGAAAACTLVVLLLATTSRPAAALDVRRVAKRIFGSRERAEDSTMEASRFDSPSVSLQPAQTDRLEPGTQVVNRDAECEPVQSCGECVAKEQCGWCPHTRTCVPGTPDAPRAGNATCAMYEYGLCKSDPCKDYPTCQSCLADPLCGYCASTGTCSEGRPSGPFGLQRICPGGYCHSPRYEDRRDWYAHHAVDPEINDICRIGCMGPASTGAAAAESENADEFGSLPAMDDETVHAADVGAQTAEEAVDDVVAHALEKVPEDAQEAVAEAIKEAVITTTLTPEEKEAIAAKARADLIEHERHRLEAIRDIKAKVQVHADEATHLLRDQTEGWDRGVDEASTAILNLLHANRTLLEGDPESKEWMHTQEALVADLARKVAKAYGTTADEMRFRRTSTKLTRRARARNPLDGLSDEERDMVSSMFPNLGQEKGRLSALAAKLAAHRVIQGRRAARRAEHDAERFMDAMYSAKAAALASARREMKGAEITGNVTVRLHALKRIADAEFVYRESVLAVESAVAKVKGMLSGDNAALLKNGANMVEALTEADLGDIEADREAQEAEEERENQARLKVKMEEHAKQAERDEKELRELQERTDEQAAKAAVDEADSMAAQAGKKAAEHELEEELRVAQGDVTRLQEQVAALEAAGASEQAEALKLELQDQLKTAQLRLAGAQAQWDAHTEELQKEAEEAAKQAESEEAAKAERELALQAGESGAYEEQHEKMRSQLQG